MISNSGACGVMAADAAEQFGLTLADFDQQTKSELAKRLPPFASVANPVDMTAALMTDSRLLGAVLPVVAGAAGADLFLIGIIVAGTGYDIDALAADTAAFEANVRRPVAVVAPQPAVAARFRAAGVATFENQTDAMRSLGQVAAHRELLQNRS